VTREAGDEIEFRNATGVSAVLRKQDIDRRGKRDSSVMPEGLVGNLTPQELAGLLAYLESLKGN
jgi:putative heme-binding domain-containing protein